MKEWNQAKKEYEEIPIPPELGERVEAGIARGRAQYRTRRLRTLRRTLGSFAACLAVLLAGLNLSPAFAAAAASVPVVGGLFQVLTVRSYTDETADRTLTVTQPAVTGDDFARRISREIQERVDAKTSEGEVIVAEAKQAFLATGGTEEEWTQRDTTVSVNYMVLSQTDTTVSFVIDTYVSVASAYQEQFYYNLDLAADRELTLEDVLGENWVETCNESIRTQMEQAEDPTVFFSGDMGGFTTVDETTAFYLDGDGTPVVVFPRCTVAIGAMGVVEFSIS